MNSLTKNPYSEQDVSSMFDQISGKYDFLNALLSMNQDKRWRKKLIEWVPQQNSAGTFLDVATGTGDFAICASKYTKAKIIGIDISNGMLDIANQKIKKKNPLWYKLESGAI